MYYSTDNGANWTLTAATGVPTSGSIGWNLSAGSFFNCETDFFRVQGRAGQAFVLRGTDGNTARSNLYYSTDGGQNWSSAINSGCKPYSGAFGFGAVYAGQSYPSMMLIGYVNGVAGLCKNFNTGTSIGTWTNGVSSGLSSPYYSGDFPLDLDGSKGRVRRLVCFSIGFGCHPGKSIVTGQALDGLVLVPLPEFAVFIPAVLP
jgi:hypothetical protein